MRLSSGDIYPTFQDMINYRNKDLLEAFGKHLREIRESNGISQETLAYNANIPVSQVGRIERGEINTTISTIYLISQALKVDFIDLMSFDLNEID